MSANTILIDNGLKLSEFHLFDVFDGYLTLLTYSLDIRYLASTSYLEVLN